MLKSMTGFGQAELAGEKFDISVQVKSVNHRYSDITVRLPRRYIFMEDKIRAAVSRSISRGKTEVYIDIDSKQTDDCEIRVNSGVAQGYISALKEICALGAKDDISAGRVARFNDVFSVNYREISEDEVLPPVLECLSMALGEFDAMRSEEGERLKNSIAEHLSDMDKTVCKIEERYPICVNSYKERLFAKLSEVLENSQIDETRIIAEAAIYADKTAVDEEIVRLRSHIEGFKAAMDTDKPIGKKLDFIIQEMNRETSTIGSKCSDAQTAAYVVEQKSIIEKIREQIQNIE